ncbi:MAG TPA: translesion DNA synthesis-associated protein ImuA [Burkholderiales bacterium]|nr:translesion DNA synthesis-associated protein ImuA [Burkholderiales bacterium]
MDPGLSALLQRPDLWRGSEAAHVAIPSIPTGFPALDALLPGGGWPRGSLTEILCEGEGIGELSLLAPALARLSRQDLWVAFVAPPHLPYAPALAAVGIDLARVVMIRPERSEDRLWAMEQALRSGSCSAVLAWPSFLTERSARRSQLAAEAGGSWGVYFASGTSTAPSPAALRLALAPADARLASAAAFPPRTLRVTILKRRGGAVPAPLLLDVPRPSDATVAQAALLDWE